MRTAMRRIAVFCNLLIFVFIADTACPVSIQKMPRLQGAGWITVKAIKTSPEETIRWKVARWLVDETSGSFTYPTDTLYSSGDSAQFNLGKTFGKYTFYKIIAFEGTEADSLTVQVLTRGVVEKYLYTNPGISPYPVPVWVVLPSQYSASSRFVMAMCGINRDASNVATYWVPFANANNYIIAAPEFSAANWNSSAYILGNMFTGSNGSGNLNAKEKWTFNIVAQIHREMNNLTRIEDSTYILWGHSAGGQFVHRFAFFLPDSLVSMYIAANSGWYTCPDLAVEYPWGALHTRLNLTIEDLRAFTKRKLVIMRGTADTLRDSELNTDPRSDMQGLNRYTRAAYFYNKGVAVNPLLLWRLTDVQNVGHSDQKMAIAAGTYILANPAKLIKEQIPSRADLLLSGYPNPFNASTRIRVVLHRSGGIRIDILDILGRRVQNIADENLPAGVHEFDFKATTLASGMYFCRITDGSAAQIMKLQLLR